MIVLIMHSETNVRYRSVVTTLLRALDWLVVVLLGQVTGHVILSSLVVGPVIDSTLVKVLCKGLLLIVNFTTTFYRTWKILASFLRIRNLSVFIIATSKTRLIWILILEWSVRPDHLEDLPWLVLDYGHLYWAFYDHIFIIIILRGFMLLFEFIIWVIRETLVLDYVTVNPLT